MDNPLDLQKAMAAAAEQLGVDPQNLQKGGADALVQRLSPQQKATLQAVLKDPVALQKVLNSPDAKALLQKFMRPKG